MHLTDPASESAMSNEPRSSEPRSNGRAGDALLTRALKRAYWAILWERLWPALAAPATAIGLFLAVSWLGTWLWLPPIGRAVGLFIFLLLTAAATVPLLLLRVPSAFEGLRRL